MREVIVSPGGMMKLKEDIAAEISARETACSSLNAGLSEANEDIAALGTAKLNANLKGAVNGVAELDSNGKVPASQLLGLNFGSENADKVLHVSDTGALDLITIPNANGVSF